MSSGSSPFAPGAQYVPPNPNAGILTARPNVRFLSQAVQPPSIAYVEIADVLRISAASSQANEVLTVNYRLLLASGGVVEGQSQMSVTSNRAINIHDEPLAEGFLLSCSCKAATATTRGQTFVRIFLTNPVLGQGQPSYMLMADYVTTAMAPAHPNGRVLTPTEGPGWIRAVSVSNPAAGAEWNIAVPTNARWRIQGVFAILSTGVVVANRQPSVRCFGGTAISWLSIQTFVQAASLNESYNFHPGASVNNLAGISTTTAPLPYGHIMSGTNADTIGSQTINLQAADQWQFIALTVEDLLENV
jgi:hypothetical protein